VKNWLGKDVLKGSLVLQSNEIQSFQAVSRTFNQSSEGTFGQEVPAVPSDSGTTRLEGKVYAVGLEKSAAFRSNLLLTELSGLRVTAEVTLVGEDGSALGSTTVDVLPFGTKQINDVFKAVGFTGNASGVRAEVEITDGDGRIVVIGSVVDNATNDPTTLYGPQKSSSVSTIVVPVVAHSAGVAGTQWVSDVSIANVDLAPRDLVVSLYDGSGALAGARSAYVAAGQTLRYLDVVKETFGIASGKGSIRIDVTPPGGLVVQSRTYNLGASGTYGQGIPGYPAAESIGSNRGTISLIGLNNTKRFRTNIGVTETSGSQVTIGISIVDNEGRDLLGYREVDVPGNGLFQTNMFQAMGLGSENIFSARAYIQVVRGSGRVTAYASTVDNATGDATTLLPPLRLKGDSDH